MHVAAVVVQTLRDDDLLFPIHRRNLARRVCRSENRRSVRSLAGLGPSANDTRPPRPVPGSTDAMPAPIANARLLRSFPAFPAKSCAVTRSHAPETTAGPLTSHS